MALTIEDGAIVAGADSYATVAEARAFATARGVTLPATDADVEVLLRKACDFLDSLETRYKGSRVEDDQPLAWPRDEVYLFGTTLFADDDIPAQVKNAQCQLVIDAYGGGTAVDLQPTGTGREVIREKVDVLETEYSERGTGSVLPEFNKAMGILAPCLAGAGFSLSVERA